MNRQPFEIPPKWWAPKLAPWAVKLTRGYRHRQLRRAQRVVHIEAIGLDYLERAIKSDQGVLITPNHSAHYDSAALYAAADQIGQPLYFMTAWQVFAMSRGWDRWLMQRLGCFSIDRESTDRKAFKQAVNILQGEPQPLVIFPEGDVYHVSDRVTPFREGAAAVALAAAKRSKRTLVIIPCGIKFWYVDDPIDELHELMLQLEERFYLRPQPQQPLVDRIYRFAEAMLALKELDYLGHTRSGSVKERVSGLTDAILSRLEDRHQLAKKKATTPERVKTLRQRIIQQDRAAINDSERRMLNEQMDDLFFVIQLYSYPGDYLRQQPTIERLAETMDKFEEDVLGLDLPRVRGRRRAVVQFSEPISVQYDSDNSNRVAELTTTMQTKVQAVLNQLNSPSVDSSKSRSLMAPA